MSAYNVLSVKYVDVTDIEVTNENLVSAKVISDDKARARRVSNPM